MSVGLSTFANIGVRSRATQASSSAMAVFVGVCIASVVTLFERVWSQPVASLAAEWGLSGPGLKKVCRRLQIPVPPRGYWAKLKAGHREARPLP